MSELRRHYPKMEPVSNPNSTAQLYNIAGEGKVGIIAGHSRLFCSSCNRVRVTAGGLLKTCLYAQATDDLKNLLRKGASNQEIATIIRNCIYRRFVDGRAAQANRQSQILESMAAIGG